MYSRGDRRICEVVVKYAHLRFKGNKDLMSFTSKIIPECASGGRAKPSAGDKRKSLESGSSSTKRERAELARLQAVMETESSKKMAAAMQVQAEALAKEAVNATLNTLLQHIGAYPIDHPVRKEMDCQVSELLGMAPKDCYT